MAAEQEVVKPKFSHRIPYARFKISLQPRKSRFFVFFAKKFLLFCLFVAEGLLLLLVICFVLAFELSYCLFFGSAMAVF
jgi:hypothetical protein